MAKILILSTPYNGSTHFAECLVSDNGYCMFDQPLDNTTPKKWIDPYGGDWNVPRGHSLINNWKYNKYEIDGLVGYNYPDNVPDNTVVTHFVNWHKLPNSHSETSFLEDFIPRFDNVLILRCEDISWNWKQHLAAINQDNNGNWFWLKYLHQSQNYEYQDSYYDEEIKNKYEKSHNFLVQYSVDNPSIPCINIDKEIWDKEDIVNFNHTEEQIEIFKPCNIPGFYDQDTLSEVIEKNKHVRSYCHDNKFYRCKW